MAFVLFMGQRYHALHFNFESYFEVRLGGTVPKRRCVTLKIVEAKTSEWLQVKFARICLFLMIFVGFV